MEKQFTWADLKELLNNLDPEFLKDPVRWWGEERGGTVKGLDILDEDYYKDDYAWQPKSVYEEEDLKDCDGFLAKGTPILTVD